MTVDVYLDVDGVLLPVYDPRLGILESGSGWHDWRYPSPTWGHGGYSPRMVTALLAALNEPHVRVHWLTTWGPRAAVELAPKIGLPDWPVLDADHAMMRGEVVTVRSWWKRDVVQAHHGEHPDSAILWIDDDLGFDRDARVWLGDLDRHGGDVLAITPDTCRGLTPDHVRRIAEFVVAARP